jgi:choline-glycine betaine transporter
MLWIIIGLLAIIALAVGGLKVLAFAAIVGALIAVAVIATMVGGFHKLADHGDELYDRDNQPEG